MLRRYGLNKLEQCGFVRIPAIQKVLVTKQASPQECGPPQKMQQETKPAFPEKGKNHGNRNRGVIPCNNLPPGLGDQTFGGLAGEEMQMGPVEQSLRMIGKSSEQEIEADVNIRDIGERNQQLAALLGAGFQLRQDFLGIQ